MDTNRAEGLSEFFYSGPSRGENRAEGASDFFDSGAYRGENRAVGARNLWILPPIQTKIAP